VSSQVQRAATLRAAGPVTAPDFFIAGHKKCGTTTLHAILRRHPQIFMPALKEPHFFATDRKARFRNPRGAELPATAEQYGALFADAESGQLAGEASASYLWSRVAADRIAAVRPDARIIALFREPADFLRSKHMQYLRIHFEDRVQLRDALAAEPARREGRCVPDSCPYPAMLLYSEHLRYVEQLRRYRLHFPPEQILVLVYEDFRADNEGTVGRILRFLGVDDAVPLAGANVNATVRTMRSQRVDDALHSAALGTGPATRAGRSLVKALTPRRVRRGAAGLLRRRVVFRDPPPPDERLMREIRERYAGEVAAFGDYIGRDLTRLWGYDRL
jgi:hypothetical protein